MSDTPWGSDSVRRSARIRGIIAVVLAVGSAFAVLVMLDLWKQTIAPGMLSLPANILLTAFLVVAAVRGFALARRGGQTERSAATDRWLCFAGLFVMFAMVFSALTGIGSGGWIWLLLYAVVFTGALFVLLLLNWKARSLAGPLDAQKPIGERRR